MAKTKIFKDEEVKEILEKNCEETCIKKVINKLDIKFPNEDLNKLVEKINEVIDKINGN